MDEQLVLFLRLLQGEIFSYKSVCNLTRVGNPKEIRILLLDCEFKHDFKQVKKGTKCAGIFITSKSSDIEILKEDDINEILSKFN